MKKICKVSIVLTLVMCLFLCCAGFSAAETAVTEEAGMAMFTEMMANIPGLENVDWEGFYAALNEKIAKGEKITLEDTMPAEVWTFMGQMMLPVEEGEDSGMNVDTKVSGNEMVLTYTLKEQADEEATKQIAESAAASFESEETKANMKNSFDQIASGGSIDITEVKLTLRFVNADGSVIYEKTYTVEDFPADAEPAA